MRMYTLDLKEYALYLAWQSNLNILNQRLPACTFMEILFGKNNDANGKNNKDRTACHSHPFPSHIPIFTIFPTRFFPPAGPKDFRSS